MKLNLTPYDPAADLRSRATAALNLLAYEANAVKARAIEAAKAPTVIKKCARAECPNTFEPNVDKRIYCSVRCRNVVQVRRCRARQGADRA